MVSSSLTGGRLPKISATTFALLALQAGLSAADCNTYTTTGPSGNQTYNNYVLYDFRNLGSQLSGTAVYSQNVDFPNGQFALSTSSYFNSTPWTNNWSNMAYKQPKNPTLAQYVDMVYTPLNVGIVSDNSSNVNGATVLSLTTNRLQSYTAAAQIQSIEHYFHASIRMSARLLGPPGACGAFYVYGDDTNESDMELLTNDTSSIFHATNHPSQDAKGYPIPGATTIAQIPQNGTANGTTPGSFNDWTDYRMDWLEDRTQWIINGDLVVDKTWNPPKIPGYLALNIWSNGGTGNLSVGETATMQIRWIEIAYNTTTDSPPANPSNCVVRDNNDASNTQAAASNNVNAAAMLSASSAAWVLILGACLWSVL